MDSLKVSNIGKTYNNRRIIRDISLEISKGEVVGLLGPNGAGKTTCFYSIIGLVLPDYGSVHLKDQDITFMPMHLRARLGLGYLPQESSVFKGLTTSQNILAVLELQDMPYEQKMARLEELLGDFGISHLHNIMASALSGGERRRLEIARCLAANPEYILLDEPLAGIDPITITEIANIIRKLKEMNIGILITDHNVREALSIIDRAYIIHDGHVIAQGSAEEIIHNEKVKSVYLGEKFKTIS